MSDHPVIPPPITPVLPKQARRPTNFLDLKEGQLRWHQIEGCHAVLQQYFEGSWHDVPLNTGPE